MTLFAQNLKRFRLGKHLTQEQAAEFLGVSTQTVSRWECSTTLPDVTVLPQIAALYGVTIDDLYREDSVAYENYAARLLAVFEASHRPEDFFRAYTEYQKLLRSGTHTANDLRSYGILHQYMMQVCRDRAEEAFDRVIRNGPGEDPETYWSTCRQKGYFLWELGRNQETVDRYLPLAEAGSNELQEWICLIQAYSLAEDLEAAWGWIQKASVKFPESATLHIYAGDILRSMKRYSEAFSHWERALEMEPQWLDAAYAMASCYEEQKKYVRAAAVYERIADDLVRRGFEEEEKWPRAMAHRCREQHASS